MQVWGLGNLFILIVTYFYRLTYALNDTISVTVRAKALTGVLDETEMVSSYVEYVRCHFIALLTVSDENQSLRS